MADDDDRYVAPYETEEGDVCVSPRQRKLHERTELASLTLGTSFLLYLSTRNRPLTKQEKDGLIVMGMGALVVDTMLYTRFRRAKKRKK